LSTGGKTKWRLKAAARNWMLNTAKFATNTSKSDYNGQPKPDALAHSNPEKLWRTIVTVRETFVVHKGFKVYNFQNVSNTLRTKENNLWKFISNQRNGSPYHLQIVDLYDKRSESSREPKNIDLSKGILVSGSIGCGKTSLMNLVRPCLSCIRVKSKHAEVSFEFTKWLWGHQLLHAKASQSIATKGYCLTIWVPNNK
jgi:predicted ATPase